MNKSEKRNWTVPKYIQNIVPTTIVLMNSKNPWQCGFANRFIYKLSIELVSELYLGHSSLLSNEHISKFV